ncbi:zinc ribbon domain-containing protein [Anaeromicropila herbilytica]|uniref:Putative zinc-ribbon domain-containing protein n=1 Tax=Anaeromicropila herbilytica TaxID=2785025 RepID=A0A7R7IC76_9FIRM|nr:zinc ribbon domain-containing protein [Anaeromicropila herbilytica]BCN29586.1 hypothetical protein bsdtb5_08810 [Anaeromicropila herbilytica]
MYMNGYVGNGLGTISMLLVFLIKFFVVAFIISLLVALFIVAKNYIFTAEDLSTIKNSFKLNSKEKKTCFSCGKNLKDEWNVCPYCGVESNIDVIEKEEAYEKSMV